MSVEDLEIVINNQQFKELNDSVRQRDEKIKDLEWEVQRLNNLVYDLQNDKNIAQVQAIDQEAILKEQEELQIQNLRLLKEKLELQNTVTIEKSKIRSTINSQINYNNANPQEIDKLRLYINQLENEKQFIAQQNSKIISNLEAKNKELEKQCMQVEKDMERVKQQTTQKYQECDVLMRDKTELLMKMKNYQDIKFVIKTILIDKSLQRSQDQVENDQTQKLQIDDLIKKNITYNMNKFMEVLYQQIANFNLIFTFNFL